MKLFVIGAGGVGGYHGALLAAARQCMPLVAANTAVLSLQNGISAADQLSRILGAEHVLAGATWLSSAVQAPGVIHHVSDSRRVVVGESDGGPSHPLREVVRILNEAGIAAESSSNIQGVLWLKLVFISAVAGFGSLTRAPVGAYRGVPEARQLLIALMDETAAVATSRRPHREGCGRQGPCIHGRSSP
jgi:2-dehydropantoate 2-reductase